MQELEQAQNQQSFLITHFTKQQAIHSFAKKHSFYFLSKCCTV